LLYLQTGTAGDIVRVPIDQDVIDGYLQGDHKLNVNFASFLNNTGLLIHMEATLQFRFRFVNPLSIAAPRRPSLTRWTNAK
jgi:hypothetical protein